MKPEKNTITRSGWPALAVSTTRDRTAPGRSREVANTMSTTRRQVLDLLATQIGIVHSSDLQGRRARCRRARSSAKASMHSWLGQLSMPHGSPARCRSAWRRSASPDSSRGSSAPSTTGAAGGAMSACRAVTHTGTGQLLLPHGSPFAWCWACASALRCAFFSRRASRSGAQISQPRCLQIRPREWASACCCFGVIGGSSAASFVDRLGCSLVGARGTGC